MNKHIREKILAYLKETADESEEDLAALSDEECRQAFNEDFSAGESVREMQFAGGSWVSVNKLGGL